MWVPSANRKTREVTFCQEQTKLTLPILALLIEPESLRKETDKIFKLNLNLMYLSKISLGTKIFKS